MRDFTNNLHPIRAISPVSVADDTAEVGQIIDRQGFDGLTFIIATGSLADTNATFAVLVEDGDDSGLSDNAAVADANLLGTEAPDSSQIPAECGGPNTGYGDTGLGHSVEWKADHSGFVAGRDRCALRAREEYAKAVDAFEDGDEAAAAFFLGAMAHYVGDSSQFGHTYPDEVNHSNHESWTATRTDSFNEGHFEQYIQASSLVRRRPYTAVKRISLRVFRGEGAILPATTMDSKYRNDRDQAFIDSTGNALNLA